MVPNKVDEAFAFYMYEQSTKIFHYAAFTSCKSP